MHRHIVSGITAALFLTACTSTHTGRELVATRNSTTSTSSTTTTAPPPSTTSVTMPPTTTTIRSAAPAPTVPASAPTMPGDDPRLPADIAAAVHRHFDRFGTDVAAWFTHIVWRESNGDPTAVSPSGCRGLSQLALPLHADLFTAQGLDWHTSWADPDANLEAAALLYASSGASPWRL